MNFPVTRQTLILRIAKSDDQEAWRLFFDDYWVALCNFIKFHTHAGAANAEDLASETLEVIIRNKLLQSWMENPSAKLRTLICSVAKRVVSNFCRINKGRQDNIQKNLIDLIDREDINTIKSECQQHDPDENFYIEWARAFIRQILERLMVELNSRGKGDYFRVFYSTVCENMTAKQIADIMNIKVTQVENYLKSVKKQLQSDIQVALYNYVQHYASPQELDMELMKEKQALEDMFRRQGGLDEIMRSIYSRADEVESIDIGRVDQSMERLTTILKPIA